MSELSKLSKNFEIADFYIPVLHYYGINHNKSFFVNPGLSPIQIQAAAFAITSIAVFGFQKSIPGRKIEGNLWVWIIWF